MHQYDVSYFLTGTLQSVRNVTEDMAQPLPRQTLAPRPWVSIYLHSTFDLQIDYTCT